MVSITLYHMLSSEMGLCSDGLYEGGLVLGSSITSACFMPMGTFLSSHIFCIRYTVMYSPVLPAPNSSSAVIPSGPHAFFILSFLRLLTISSYVGVHRREFWETKGSSVSSYIYSQNYTNSSSCCSLRVMYFAGFSFLWAYLNCCHASEFSEMDYWS